VRRTAAIAMVVVLAVAWFVTARVGDGDALAQGGDAASTPVTRPTAGGGIAVEYRHFAGQALEARYRTAIGSGPGAGRTAAGPPVCARGGEEERAWSRPVAPGRAVGRYACRVERGRAAMWWTVDDRGLLAHAIASNADLGSLFAWWEAHSER
jgi:hypothetical protein